MVSVRNLCRVESRRSVVLLVRKQMAERARWAAVVAAGNVAATATATATGHATETDAESAAAAAEGASAVDESVAAGGVAVAGLVTTPWQIQQSESRLDRAFVLASPCCCREAVARRSHSLRRRSGEKMTTAFPF